MIPTPPVLATGQLGSHSRVDKPAASTKETRVAPRLSASHVPSITGVRLAPNDVEATLMNISTHGVAVECGRRFLPKSEVTVCVEGTFEPSSIAGRVARCAVVGIGPDGGLRYQVGIAFAHPIDLADTPSPVPPRPETPRLRPAPAKDPPTLRNRW